jgi:hypothetical protein
MLIHAMISWPEIITEQLWLYAIRLAIDLHNSTPTSDPSLQHGHKIPRWKPHSRVGVYLGLSTNHASNIPLVLSTTTDLVSPQFHVVYDDKFTTTQCLHTNILPTNWSTPLSTSSSKYIPDDLTINPS